MVKYTKLWQYRKATYYHEFILNLDKYNKAVDAYGDLYAVFKLASGAACRSGPCKYL